jgi:two-component system cell cycle response regulator
VGDGEKPLILVVDDEDQVLQHFEGLLSKGGYGVVLARNGKDALARVRDSKPDLVLLDIVMPGMDGLEVCRIIKSRRDSAFLPVIILTAKNDMESRVEGLKLGADDYLGKPADPRELMARIEALLRIKQLQDRISTSKREMEDTSVTDSLTGLYNDRYLRHRLRDEFKRAERYSEPLSYIAVNLDEYDDLQKKYGRDNVDRMIKDIAEILRTGIREFDVVVRSALEQFVILLPRTHFTGSLSVATRIWQKIQQHRFLIKDSRIPVGVSMGVSFFPNKDVSSADKLMSQANEALDKARQAGSNQICLYQHTTYFYRHDMTK